MVVGRYAIFDAIASGGMATVHLGRLIGPVGFPRTVAIKRLHPQFAKDPEFTSMFLDEARLAARIQHPNVVPTLDVVQRENELLLVMEYVHGESLVAPRPRARAIAGERMPPRDRASPILAGALQGLHAAHEARRREGRSRSASSTATCRRRTSSSASTACRASSTSASPRPTGRMHTTRDGQRQGQAPLHVAGAALGAARRPRTADIYAAGVVLFESLTGPAHVRRRERRRCADADPHERDPMPS